MTDPVVPRFTDTRPMSSQAPLNAVVTGLLREAVAANRSNDRPRAHALFRQATEHDPGNEAAWLWFANTADDPRDAVTGLRNALRLNPAAASATAALPVALVRAGAVSAKAGDRAAATDYLTQAVGLDPANETAWLWLAGVTADPGLAAEHLERVLQINPDNAHARQGIAKLRAAAAGPTRCPLCGHQPDEAHDTVADTCGKCRAVLNLARPEAFDGPVPGLSRPLVEAAARRLKVTWSTTPTAETAFGLALAFLNLGHVEEGKRAAQIALQARGLTQDRREEIGRFLGLGKAGGDAQPVARRTAVIATSGMVRNVPRSAPVVSLPPPTWVMVVDDSPTVRKTVAVTLSKAGYQVTEAADAEEAARLIHEGGAPKLFILDVNLPGTDGFALCKLLRGEAATAHVPVIFLTGKTGILNKLYGKWVGAADYVTKPLQPRALLAAVTNLVPAPAPAQ